jgi:hypothetical protein
MQRESRKAVSFAASCRWWLETTTYHDVGILLRTTANAVGCLEIEKSTALLSLGCAFAKVVVAVDVS